MRTNTFQVIEQLVRFCLRFRLLFSFLVLLATVLSLFFLRHHGLPSDNAVKVWFEENDPDYLAYQDFVKTFGHDRFVMIGYEMPDVFTPEALRVIYNTTEALGRLPEVERVTSLTHAEVIDADDDSIRIHPFLESVAKIPNETDFEMLAALKARALSDPDFVDNLISKDATVATIIAKVSIPEQSAASRRLKKIIDAVVAEKNTARFPVTLAGEPIVDEAFNRLSVRDQKILLPATVLVMILVVYFFFRNFYIALLPLLLQMIVLAWVYALYQFLGHKMNVVVGMLASILIAVCVADAVHLVLEYTHHSAQEKDTRKALVKSAASLWWPCLFTAGTTFVGFISFQSSSIPPINLLGNFTALAVALVFGLTIFWLPAVLSFLPGPAALAAREAENGRIRNMLAKIAALNEQRPKTIFLVFALLAVLGGWGVSKLKIESNYTEYFPWKEKVRQDIEFFRQKMAGTGAFELVLTGKNGKPATNPGVLKTIADFSEKILEDPQTTAVYSLTGYVKKLNKAFHENDDRYYAIPDSSEEIAQLLLLASSSGDTEIGQYKTLDDEKLRLSFKTPLISSNQLKDYLRKVEKEAREKFSKHNMEANITGFAALWVELENNILSSQITSFAIAFIVITFMMALVLKSLKVGLISMVPNVLPILYTLGLMGFAGLHLNVSTVMIAAVSVGITVDDTIHYLTRFKMFLDETGDYKKAMEKTNDTIGTAILFTSVTLTLGFLVLVLGSFTPTVYFGGMVALTLFLSIFCEIFLTPILILWLKPYKIKT